MPGITSAGGALALLREDDVDFKVFGVLKLTEIVDVFWAEIADALGEIEILQEDKGFPEREAAALLASKVYYHLGAFDESLTFALQAGDKFDVASGSKYVSTMISQAIDSYSHQRRNEELPNSALEDVVNRMFDKCLSDKSFKEAIGIAIESRRLDILDRALSCSSDTSLLEYTFETSMQMLNNKSFQDQVLSLLVQKFEAAGATNYASLTQCYAILGDAKALATLLFKLYSGTEPQQLLALQLAFDVQSQSRQQLLVEVQSVLQQFAGEETDISKLSHILSGKVLLELYIEFLSKNNHSDKRLLDQTKAAVETNTVCHNAVVLAHMLMNAGTTSDSFLRDNKDWLAKASNWAKFSVVGSLGVIHKGNAKSASNILSPYLPQSGSTNPYESSGGLFATGLIHAGFGHDVVPQLLDQLSSTTEEIVQHGGCLGVGLAALGSSKSEVTDDIRRILHSDSAVAGEAAGVGLGLNSMGSNDTDLLSEMLNYARDTQHEKIIRGLSLGMAIITLGCKEQALGFINELLSDKDPWIRMGGCMALGIAYAGTGDNEHTKTLLHITVTDASDNVRRTAATALGFIMLRHGAQLPSLLKLLCESFNPHVRGGCCLALGIACAGSGSVEALELMDPLFKDATPFVRQLAFVSASLILIQAGNDHPKIAAFRKTLQENISELHCPLLSRFGAILAQGILHAGGQNVSINLSRSHGHIDELSVVGLLVFSQFWFWFPYTHFLSLALQPTALIGLNKKLQMPQMDFVSAAPPSKFAYAPKTEAPKETSKEKVETAVLSITSKAEKLKAKKEANENVMDTKDDKPTEDAKPEKPDEPEADFEMISNPARVVPAQLGVVSISEKCRYHPVLPIHGCVVILSDSTPGEEELIVELTPGQDTEQGSAPIVQESEVPVPAPFEFDESKET